MEFHEKSLELNITHELLNLADSWHWFLTDIPLWRYWRPRYRLPFLKFPKSTSGGFHITTEGKRDSTGKAGGGFDVRIKSGIDGSLLFIQYKKGELVTVSPDPKSEFDKLPHDHFKFKINSKSTNQHFTLRELANGIGKEKGNAVVYAFPLIANMAELEENAGKLIRKTKFVSILDIDNQAKINKVKIETDKVHNFRIGKFNMNRCEVNYYYYYFNGKDRTPEIISDIIAIKFQKTLSYFMKEIKKNYNKFGLDEEYIPYGIRQSFMQYLRFLFHYFEVSPTKINIPYITKSINYFYNDEFKQYENNVRDIEILTSIFNELDRYEKFINDIENSIPEKLFEQEVPKYKPKFLIQNENENDFYFRLKEQKNQDFFDGINYILI